MTSPASVGGRERLRLFLALRLPDDVVRTIVAWQERELRGRLVPAGNLHVTLAFLGSRPAAELAPIVDVLARAARAAVPPPFELVRWRETRAAGMLELRDVDGEGARLARQLHADLEELGVYRPERREWLPHVTVLRHRDRPRLAPPLPEVPRFAPSDAAAYLSTLHPAGARYEVLDTFRLGG